MALPVLIIGKSGSGKTASLRNLNPADTEIISVINKELPFRKHFPFVTISDNYPEVVSKFKESTKSVVVIDDAGYLMTNKFMREHANPGKGNNTFELYNTIGDHFWLLIQRILEKPGKQRVYIIMHEDKNEFGDVKPKTIGRLLDEKVCIEGMFTICLRCKFSSGKHIFLTQSDGYDVAKSPMDMFPTLEIDNDLAQVDKAICDYYQINDNKEEPHD